MKAISLHQPWASLIASGDKTIETRWWRTPYRGDLLICSTQRPVVRDLPCGRALAIVNVWDCLPYCTDHARNAGFSLVEAIEIVRLQKSIRDSNDHFWSWFLRDIRRIKEPFKVVGRQRFFNVELSGILFFEDATK